MPIQGRAKLIDKEGLTSSIVQYKFEMIDPIEMNFIPGQHIVIDIGENNTRQYSIASSPLKSNKTFDIVVDLSPQGKGSKYLESLDMNQEIKFIGETGEFTLPDELALNLVFLATSTGISPIRSMIDSIVLNREDYEVNIYLYIGARNSDQVIWQNVFKKYLDDKHIDDYHLYIGEGELPSTECESGNLTQFISRINDQIISDAQFIICGSGETIENIRQILISKNIPSESIIYEKHY